MRKKILSIGIATLLLVSMLCVGGFGVSAATVTGGTMQELTTAEQTAALGDSLLAGKTAILPAGAAGTDLEKITDGQCDTIHGTSRATVKPAGFVNGSEALTMRLWFDLGTARQLNRLLVASSSFNPYQIFTGSFYVADDADELFTAAHRALSYNYGTDGCNQWGAVATNGRAVRPVMLFDLSACYTGRYIGFEIVKPAAASMNWQDWGAGFLISELGAYYSAPADGVINAAVSALPEETSLIAGKTAEKGAGQSDRDSTQLSALTDGNLTTTYSTDSGSANDGWARLTYTLDSTAFIDRVLIASMITESKYYLFRGEVYISEEKSTLWNSENRAFSYNYKQGTAARNYLYTLPEAHVGKYIGFKTWVNGNEWWSAARFGQLAVYGSQPTDLIAGKTAELGAGQTNRGGDIAYLTDGDRSTVFATDSGDANDGWARLVFTLDTLSDIERITLTSSAEGSSFYLYSGAVYVSDTKEELFLKKNQVVAYSYGQGNAARSYTYALAQAARGAYVGFTVRTDGDGWWYCARIAELNVYGTACDNPLVSIGAQLRNPKATDGYALRFKFGVANQGIAYANREVSYAANISGATVVVNGENRTVVELGAVVSNDPAAANGLTLDMLSKRTLKVVAENLYEVEDGMAQYTAVITKIPADKTGTNLYAVPYVTYETDDGTATVYGELLTRTVAQFLE